MELRESDSKGKSDNAMLTREIGRTFDLNPHRT